KNGFVLSPPGRMSLNSEPGQGLLGGLEKGLGRMESSRGRYLEGRNSPAWWHASPPMRMKPAGEDITRASAHRCPIAWPGAVEEVEASIAEIVKGVEISYLEAFGELDLTQFA